MVVSKTEQLFATSEPNREIRFPESLGLLVTDVSFFADLVFMMKFTLFFAKATLIFCDMKISACTLLFQYSQVNFFATVLLHGTCKNIL